MRRVFADAGYWIALLNPKDTLHSPNADVVPMTSTAFRDAMKRYHGRTDKAWGLTDCTSFLIMEQKGIADALSADRDFQQAGFNALLLD